MMISDRVCYISTSGFQMVYLLNGLKCSQVSVDVFLSYLFCFLGVSYILVLSILLVLCSGITPGSAQEIIWSSGDGT